MGRNGKIYRSCALCKNKAVTGEKPQVTFHRFPRDGELRTIWMKVCGFIQNVDVVDTLFVCSNHFNSHDFINSEARELGKPLQLKAGTFPSVMVPNPIDPLYLVVIEDDEY